MVSVSHQQGGSRARRKPTTTTPDLSNPGRNRELNVVFASSGCTESKIVQELLPQLVRLPDISVQTILDSGYRGQDFLAASSCCLTLPNVRRQCAVRDVAEVEQEAAELCEWADLLVLAPIDANTLAKMLHGGTDNLLLELLRSWNVSKKVLMVPGMSTHMWDNPMTKKQLNKIRLNWNWIHVLQPLLWTFKGDKKHIVSWEAADDLIDGVRNQIDLMNVGQDIETAPSRRQISAAGSKFSKNHLPPELWSIIMDHTGDWELAQTLRIYTNLPPPAQWASHTSPNGPRNYMEALEFTILRGNVDDMKHFIDTHSEPRWFSKLCLKLIMRFARTDLLAHFEANHRVVFWHVFGGSFLPVKASSAFGRTEILEFWRTSTSFSPKEYHSDALDGASRAGFVNVLEWWQHSGLPLKFTEAALEQASSQGHLQVLEWWKSQSTTVDDSNASVDSSKVRLKPGKSIVFATQNGHTEVVRWWLYSGIDFGNEDAVAKLASTHGHVDILQLWHEAKGNKMIFDNQVLVGASKNGNVNVLEWWKQSGLKVEYKTCDVEEALEDGHEGERGMAVRKWWARNGLNLGVGTSEWMKTKTLNNS